MGVTLSQVGLAISLCKNSHQSVIFLICMNLYLGLNNSLTYHVGTKMKNVVVEA